MHTPLFCGDPFKAGAVVLLLRTVRPLLTNWLTVGISPSHGPFVKLIIIPYLIPFFKGIGQNLKKLPVLPRHVKAFFPSFPRLSALRLHLIIDIM